MKRKTKPETPTLIAYWDKLTKADVMLINLAVKAENGRDNPGALPFLEVSKACGFIQAFIGSQAHKGPYYRLLHKLESWRYWTMGGPQRLPFYHMVKTREFDKLVPKYKRQYQDTNRFIFELPFARGEWVMVKTSNPRVENIVRDEHLWEFICSTKQMMALRAWLEGITIKKAWHRATKSK